MLWLWLVACGGGVESAGEPARAPAAGRAVGWIDATEADVAHELSAATGRFRVVNFWATWCQPCLREIPELEAFADAHSDVDLVFVSLDHPSIRARGPESLAARGLDDRPVLHLGVPDATEILGRTVQGWTNGLPLTAVIGPDGTRVATFPYAITRDDLATAVAPQ
jgi:thiol-disulfide isomerase/thioredoxin